MQQSQSSSKVHARRARALPLALALAALLGVALLSPVSAHHTPKHTRKQIRAINAELQDVNEALEDRYTKGEADALFEDSGTALTFFEQHDRNNPTSVPLAEAGPFELRSFCDDEGNVHTRVILDSSEAGGVFRGPEGNGPLSTGGGSIGGVDKPTGVLGTNGSEIGGHAAVPSGWAIDFRVAIATSMGGWDCTFTGWVLITGRP